MKRHLARRIQPQGAGMPLAAYDGHVRGGRAGVAHDELGLEPHGRGRERGIDPAGGAVTRFGDEHFLPLTEVLERTEPVLLSRGIDIRRRGDAADPAELPELVLRVLEQLAHDGAGQVDDADGVAVGLGHRQQVPRDHPAGAGDVPDDDVDAQLLPHHPGHGPAVQVETATRSGIDQPRNGLAGILVILGGQGSLARRQNEKQSCDHGKKIPTHHENLLKYALKWPQFQHNEGRKTTIRFGRVSTPAGVTRGSRGTRKPAPGPYRP